MSANRSLMMLTAAALLSVALAAFVLHQRAQEGTPQFAPGEFLPGFAAHVKDAARIHIVSHDATFDITYTPDKGWVLPQSGNYPADFDEVRHTLIGLATLETIQPKTARPDWLHDIALDTPPKGGGILITVSDAGGHVLASLIAGTMETIGDPNGAAGLFVRRLGDNQSWLAKAVFVPHGVPSEWMLLKVLDIDAARLKDMTITPTAGAPFTLARAHMSDIDFALSPPAKNADPQRVNAIPTAITAFSAQDVRPASQIDFGKASHVTAHTFDGLGLRLDAAMVGADVWVRLSATAAADATAAIKDQASALDARTAGWAYKLSPDKGRLLMSTQTMLAASKPGAAP